ncbi:MAG: class II fumarate hydratase, partial [Myxococcales bacterium]|nr:class II fumarate hydratase [Myxococcales bacterium]
GNQTTVSVAASQGNFELYVCNPVIVHAVLESLRLLSDAASSFEVHCVRGLEANPEALRAGVEASLMLVTALSPHVGYDEAAAIAKQASREGTSLREAALARGSVSASEFDAWVRPEEMTRPG